jgi:hypothetical protein
LRSNKPLKVDGLTDERSIIWKNLCMIGSKPKECILEFSISPNKFNIVAFEISHSKNHVLELFTKQA